MKNLFCVFTGMFVCATNAVAGTVEYTGVHDEDIYFDSGIVKNYGTLNGTNYVNDYATVWFQNYGQINGPFNYGTNVVVLQQVTGADNLHKIQNLSGHTVQVSNAHNISMSELAYTAENAVQINLEDSSVIIDANFQDFTVPLRVVGNSVTFCVAGAPENWLDSDVAVLSNISGQTPFVQVINDNPLYSVQSNLSAGTLYVKSVRQTNYSAVTPDPELGEYLDQLQNLNPDDPLIQELNNAGNMHQVHDILSRSPRTNPIKLMDAAKTINSFASANLRYTADLGVYTRFGYATSDDFSYYDLGVSFGGRPLDDLIAIGGLNVGRIGYSDNYNDAIGALYGGNLGLHYDVADYFINLYGAFSYVQFYDISVFDNGRAVKNPHGQSEIIVLDAGTKFNAFDTLNVMPFVGFRFDKFTVLGHRDFDSTLRAGVDAMNETKFDENLYSVGLRAFIESDKTLYAGIHTDVLSTADSIAGGLGLGLVHDDMGWTYQITLNAKFLF